MAAAPPRFVQEVGDVEASLSRGAWVALQRRATDIPLLLVCLARERFAVLVDTAVQPPQARRILRLRALEEVYAAQPILAVTEDGGSLWLEDVLTWAGRPVWRVEPLPVRLALLARFTAGVVSDEALQGGLRLRARPLLSLQNAAAKMLLSAVSWEFVPIAAGQPRLRLCEKNRRDEAEHQA